MIHSTINYIKNPLFFASSPLEQQAIHFLTPARLIFEQLSSSPLNKLIVHRDRKIEFSESPRIINNFASLTLHEKVHRVARLISALIAAILLTPIALFLHQIALYADDGVKDAYDELEEWNSYPELMSAMTGKFNELKRLLDATPIEKCEVFFRVTSLGRTVLRALLDYCPQFSQQHIKFELIGKLIEKCPENKIEMLYLKSNVENRRENQAPTLLEEAIAQSETPIILALIDRCPEDKVDDYLKIGGNKEEHLIKWAVRNKNIAILSRLLQKYQGKIECVLGHMNGEETLLDISERNKSHQISFLLLNACPFDKLDLLCGPHTDPWVWSIQFQQAFHNKMNNQFVEDRGKIKDLLTKIQSDGNTILHRSNQKVFFKTYFDMLGIEISKVFNQDGLSPIDLVSYEMNPSWLSKPKFHLNHEHSISLREYSQKAAVLKSEVLRLWDGLRFGQQSGELSPQLLFLKGSRESPSRIRKLLELMLDRIVKKEAWLATPRAENSAGLHSFYSEMLSNFENVVTYLKKSNNPVLTAGNLIDIAKVQLEGRCAAAYQEEIEQKALICVSEQVTTEQLIERIACKVLRALVVETLTKSTFFAIDVHASRRANYACGLVRNADPLDQMNPDFSARLKNSRNGILGAFNLTTFIRSVSKHIERTVAVDCVKQLAPELKPYSFFERGTHGLKKFIFGSSEQPKTTQELYREAVIKAKKREHELETTALEGINEVGSFDAKQIFQAIKNLKSVSLPDITQGENLILKIIAEENKKLIATTNCDDLDLQGLVRELKSDYQQIEERVITHLKEKNKWNLQIRLKIQNQLSQILQKRIEPARKFFQLVVKQTHKRGALAQVIQIQKTYQAGLLKILEDLQPEVENDEFDLSFNQQIYQLPSQAIENNYRTWQTQEDLTYHPRMIFKLLISKGILVKKR